jgi:hypothetical protein
LIDVMFWSHSHLTLAVAAAAKPAGGAALDQVAIATAGATVASLVVYWLINSHRRGRSQLLERAGRFAQGVSGLPAWAALPTGLGGGALLVALLGMYWDISFHIDDGRDPGPLANPAHYLILIGLYGIFTAGVLAMALPRAGERPGPAAVRLTRDWYAPVGGMLMAACGAYALIGFPLDDIWHRLFGQDVTLWGPTHLMLIGGAGMTLIGQAVLLAEGVSARRAAGRASVRGPGAIVTLRRVALTGGLLIGLSTFQGEFDFGVPQFRMVLHPLLIAVAAGVALVGGRLWAGPGGALGTAGFFLLVRGIVSLIVGGVFGKTMPALALFVGEALCVELAALALARRPLALGAVAGALIGTVGMASEWAWSSAVMRLPWTPDILPESVLLAVVGGIAGGLLGALLALGLRGCLPARGLTRATVALCGLAIAACLVDGLITTPGPRGASASMRLDPSGQAVVRVHPASLADGASWLSVTAWQGGGLHVDRLRRVGPDAWRTHEPIPVTGQWKAMVRLQNGRRILSAPIYLPADPAIPVPGVAARASSLRPFLADHRVLQRERKQDVAAWLWGVAGFVVLALSVAFLTALALGVGRVGRAIAGEPPASSALSPGRFARSGARDPAPAG